MSQGQPDEQAAAALPGALLSQNACLSRQDPGGISLQTIIALVWRIESAKIHESLSWPAGRLAGSMSAALGGSLQVFRLVS